MRTFIGRVVSDKMVGTVAVEVERSYRHPLYGKILKRQRKIHATDAKGAKMGQLVKIAETRPTAKTVCFKVTEILHG